jgi:hypothetical protein
LGKGNEGALGRKEYSKYERWRRREGELLREALGRRQAAR